MVNGSHHDENPLLVSIGIQIATKPLPGPTNGNIGIQKGFLVLGGLHEDKLCDTLQAMAPTNNVETVDPNSLLHIYREQSTIG